MSMLMPGFEQRKRKKVLTEQDKKILIDKARRVQSEVIKMLNMDDQELKQMIDDICGGYRNYSMHYMAKGKKRSFSAYVRLFSFIEREVVKGRVL